jgi:hypothetical protein
MEYTTGLLELDALAYHLDPCDHPSLSTSQAHVLNARSPLHLYHLHPRFGARAFETTDEMDTGTLWHALLLGKGSERIGVVRIKDKKTGELVNAEDFRTDAAKQARDELRAKGMTPVLFKHIERASVSLDRVRKQLDEHGVHLGTQREVVALWVEHASDGTPVQCRTMLDALELSDVGAVIQDFKTTDSAHPTAIRNHVERFGYAVQSAAATSAIEHIVPELAGRVHYEWIFAERDAPNAVAITAPAGSMQMLGAQLWQRAVDAFARCLKADVWPGYGRLPPVEASPWALSSVLEEAMHE